MFVFKSKHKGIMNESIKIGDTVHTWCAGEFIEGVITDLSDDAIRVKHTPVRWGSASFSETIVTASTGLQGKYYAPTTPACYDKAGNLIEL